ncbi:MAG: serine hydrolase [Erythrobacter sp.]
MNNLLVSRTLRFATCLSLSFIAATAPSTALSQEAVESEVLAEVSSDLETLRQMYGTPGLAVAIVKDGELIYAKGFGYRNVANGLPATPETIFPTGSVTKQFTAALIGIHQGDGALTLADRPSQHLGDFRFNNEHMDTLITIADLLSHRSGIGNVDATHVFFPTDDRTEHLARLRYLTPNSDVRERFDYSNMGYAVVAAVDEGLSGQSWERQIEERFFKPLGMARSSVSVLQLLSSENIATGYGMIDGNPFPVLYEDQHEAGPSGALNSTVIDLSNWMVMLLNEGRYENAQIVPAAFLADAFSAQAWINPTYNPRSKTLRLDAYGYGWFVSEYEGYYRVNHGGNTSGFTARIDLLPSEGLGVAILTNQQSTELPRYATDIIYRRMLGLPSRDVTEYPVQITDATAIGPVDTPNQQQPPTNQLEGYVGQYTNPGYGRFNVTLRDGALYIAFPAFSFALEHQQDDVFVTKSYYEIHQNSPSFPIEFQTNAEGAINGATMPLQAEPILFVRD